MEGTNHCCIRLYHHGTLRGPFCYVRIYSFPSKFGLRGGGRFEDVSMASSTSPEGKFRKFEGFNPHSKGWFYLLKSSSCLTHRILASLTWRRFGPNIGSQISRINVLRHDSGLV